MASLWILVAGLLAALSPWPLSVLLPLEAARRGLRGVGVCALLLLALASRLHGPEDGPEHGAEGGATQRPRGAATGSRASPASFGVRLTGRWRAPPAGIPHLETTAGPVPLAIASDLPPPSPGSWLTVLARLAPDGGATAVHLAPAVHPAPAEHPAPIAPPVPAEHQAPPVPSAPAEGTAADRSGAWPERVAESAGWRARALAPGDASGLLRSLLLGDRTQLDGATRAAFRATGTSHLLALSGLHVSLLAAVAGRALGPRLAALWLCLFTWVAGPRAPLLRALTGRALAFVCTRGGRPPRPLHNLLLVALVLVAWMGPAIMASLSARLSFLAVGGLIGAARLVPWLPAAVVLAPAGAVLATAPLCVATFGQVQPVGILLTPVLTPLVSLVLALGSLTVLPGSAFSLLDPVLGPPLAWSAEALIDLVHAAQAVAPAPLHPPPPPLDPTVMGLAVVWALSVLGRGRSHRLAAAA